MADVFDEVEEQLRSERYRTMAIKALPWVLAVAVATVIAVGGVWGWRAYQANAAAKASEQYAAALDDFNAGRVPKAVAEWTAISTSPSRAYKAMSLMHLGGVKIDDNKPAEAVRFFDDAAKAAPDPIIADIASLKAAFALMDSAPYKDIEARLTPLTQEGRPYRASAREALAFAKLMAGDLGGARSDFKVLTLLPDSPQGLRARAQAALDLIDAGSAKDAAGIAKAAAALPPEPKAPPQAAAPGAPASPEASQQQQAPGPQ